MNPNGTLKRRWTRRLTVLVVIGVALGVLAVVAVAGSLDPACRLCHRSVSTAMAATEHSAVGCYKCHLAQGVWSLPSQKADEMLSMYPRTLVGVTYRGPVTQTSSRACLKCHASVLNSNNVTSGNGLRIKHSTCAEGSTCDTCHSQVAHGKSVRWVGAPVMEDCVACHEQKGASTECPTCHVEAKERTERSRGPWQVTHGQDWKKTHGMGDATSCQTCHPRDFCEKCHKVAVPHPIEFGGTHGKLAIQDPSSCQTCHKSTRFCNACHGIAMPHPADFLKQHSKLAKGSQDPACLRCHDDADCDNCHANHIHPGATQGVPVPWQYTQGGAK